MNAAEMTERATPPNNRGAAASRSEATGIKIANIARMLPTSLIAKGRKKTGRSIVKTAQTVTSFQEARCPFFAELGRSLAESQKMANGPQNSNGATTSRHNFLPGIRLSPNGMTVNHSTAATTYRTSLARFDEDCPVILVQRRLPPFENLSMKVRGLRNNTPKRGNLGSPGSVLYMK